MIGDDLLGVGYTNSFYRREQWCPEPSWGYAFFCPVCGHIWARVWSETTTKSWWPISVACKDHGIGSITDREWILDGYINGVPVKVLQRDFLIESERLLKEQQNEPASTDSR
jgi:hypothetical protein